ncbi:hypothetical protein N0V87_007243 [Didymella glomerata]|uniref:Enoyl reductase (ER) domain-containing protein n=1 Tax=Didymella glomerata TaxID=749621 RepID=A0A9W8WV62_9PLEO|nr:hypothetical protein N0V87_007243 [Didymella glomerata]
MSGVVLTGHGGPEKLEYRTDLPVPDLSPTEVLIRVAAAGINNTDINTRIGWYGKGVKTSTSSESTNPSGSRTDDDASWSGTPFSFPRVQGADCCGRIVAVGAAVMPSRIGERVLVRTLLTAYTSGRFECWTFGSECDGAFAQYTKAPSSEVYAVNVPRWSDAELGSIPCAFSTAENMGESIVKMLCKMTAEVVLDVVAGPSFSELLDVLKKGGRYTTAGAIAGPIVELDVRTLYLKDLSFFGCTFQADEVFADLVEYIERGEIKPQIGQVFKLKDIRTAQEVFQAKISSGKLILEID